MRGRQPCTGHFVCLSHFICPSTLGLCPSSHQTRHTRAPEDNSLLMEGPPLAVLQAVSCTRPVGQADKWGLKSSHCGCPAVPRGAFTDGQKSPGAWPPSCFSAGYRVKLGLVAGLNQLSFLPGYPGLSSHLKAVQTQVIAKQTGSRERQCWKERVH